MTGFELIYTTLLPFEHPLYQHINRVLRNLNADRLLDVGGRRSNYTIGLRSQVWISDVPRERDAQHRLDLGTNDTIRGSVVSRRSNIVKYVYDDMTVTSLPVNYFDVVSAVEVLEHVQEDMKFVLNVAKVLRPGGYFVMTTPNGDWRPEPYPDHKRHYRREQLDALLRPHFSEVKIEYRVNGGKLHRIGHSSGHIGGMWAYGLSAALERVGRGGSGPDDKLHLVAVCRK